MDKITINAKAVAAMCAGHFIYGFSPADLEKEVFCSAFDVDVLGYRIEVSYRLTILAYRVVAIQIDTIGDMPIYLSGPFKDAAQFAIGMIGAFLDVYRVVFVSSGGNNSFDDGGKDRYYERKYK